MFGHDIWDSSMAAAVFTVCAAGIGSTLVMMIRLAVKFGHTESVLVDIRSDISDIKNDADVVRWSKLAQQGSILKVELQPKSGR